MLKGKIAIVTGAAGHLGSACARQLAREGAQVVISDLPDAGLDAVLDDIGKAGGEAIAQPCDLTSEAEIAALIESAIKTYGGIDALVNVAALMNDMQNDRDLLAMDTDYWDRAMAVNLRGTMLACKHAIPAMLERGGGAIVNFGSTSGVLGDIGLFAYSSTKSALLGLTRTIATTYGKHGIRCNAVCPGSVWTEETKAMMPDDMLDMMTRSRLTPRLGEADDIAHMVAYLVSDKAAYITGQPFLVDGGGTAHQPWVRMK